MDSTKWPDDGDDDDEMITTTTTMNTSPEFFPLLELPNEMVGHVVAMNPRCAWLYVCKDTAYHLSHLAGFPALLAITSEHRLAESDRTLVADASGDRFAPRFVRRLVAALTEAMASTSFTGPLCLRALDWLARRHPADARGRSDVRRAGFEALERACRPGLLHTFLRASHRWGETETTGVVDFCIRWRSDGREHVARCPLPVWENGRLAMSVSEVSAFAVGLVKGGWWIALSAWLRFIQDAHARFDPLLPVLAAVGGRGSNGRAWTISGPCWTPYRGRSAGQVGVGAPLWL